MTESNINLIFPKWNPRFITVFTIYESIDRKKAFNFFRNSSSGFIKNNIVRKSILSKSNNSCAICSSNLNLQIDHIISVKNCFENEKFDFCNTYENLQILCLKCNTSKKP